MTHRRAFSLIEVLMSVFILGIGVIAIASLLPAGIKQQQNARDTSVGPVVAQSAIGLLRTKFKQSDFGGDDAFYPQCSPLPEPNCGSIPNASANYFCRMPPGDFGWTRPARWASSPLFPKGAVHPFVAPPSALPGGNDSFWWNKFVPNFASATSDPLSADDPCYNARLDSGRNFTSRPPSTRNIPLNSESWPCGEIDPISILNGSVDLKALSWFITQEERQWPRESENPKYYWDCMFKKTNGIVEVAIFVYRIESDIPGGLIDSDDGAYVYPGSRRPHAVWLGEDCDFWRSGQRVVNELAGEPSPYSSDGPNNYDHQWQAPGQLILDEFGGVHRVVRGRTSSQSPAVEFAAPILTPSRRELVDLNGVETPVQIQESIRQIWFIPVIEKGGRRITPVYIAVEAL